MERQKNYVGIDVAKAGDGHRGLSHGRKLGDLK